jgi:hypothetical protein
MIFFAISIIFLFCMYILTRKFALGWRIILVVLVIAIFAFIISTLKINVRAEQLAWYNLSPYKQIVALLFMLMGMVGKYFYDMIEIHKKRKKEGQSNAILNFDRWEFIQPFIISFIVFGAFWATHGKEELTFNYLIISFQNGFFWETVLNKR